MCSRNAPTLCTIKMDAYIEQGTRFTSSITFNFDCQGIKDLFDCAEVSRTQISYETQPNCRKLEKNEGYRSKKRATFEGQSKHRTVMLWCRILPCLCRSYTLCSLSSNLVFWFSVQLICLMLFPDQFSMLIQSDMTLDPLHLSLNQKLGVSWPKWPLLACCHWKDMT